MEPIASDPLVVVAFAVMLLCVLALGLLLASAALITAWMLSRRARPADDADPPSARPPATHTSPPAPSADLAARSATPIPPPPAPPRRSAAASDPSAAPDTELFQRGAAAFDDPELEHAVDESEAAEVFSEHRRPRR